MTLIDLPGAEPEGGLDAWLVTDLRSELIARIRQLARRRGVEPQVGKVSTADVRIEPVPVVHTSHDTYGYLITAGQIRIVWAPEYSEFPAWAAGADLMFADAAGWRRPVRFARGVGGHETAFTSALEARRLGIRRLVFAHLGRSTLRAIDSGDLPPFGEFVTEGRSFPIELRPDKGST